MGPKEHERLEAELVEWTGMPYVVACSSGTAALHLACEALGVRGKAVTVPDYTMIACPNAVAAAGGIPVFVDCEDRDLLVSRELLAAANEALRPSATMLVHVYGRRCDDPGRSPYRVIEDMAEVHGISPYPGTEAACWSFYRNKVVHGEEGGAVAFRDRDAADKARRLRCLGFTDAHDYTHEPYGMNYRLADTLAGLISKSLSGFGAEVSRRREYEAVYDEACPLTWKMPPRDSPWVYDFRVRGMTGKLQDLLVRGLNERFAAEARHAFKPMCKQPQYLPGPAVVTKPGRHEADIASQEVVYLPLYGAPPDPARAASVFGFAYDIVCANQHLLG